ncbi:MAG: carbamoyltransferase HypF, partial [Snowella sp.]
MTKTMLVRNLNSPITSSAGRLFDGVASLLNLCQQGTYEGQAAMLLEFAIREFNTEAYYPFTIKEKIIDWQLIIEAIINDISRNITVEKIAAKFHNTLVEIIINIAQKVGEPQVILTGGCWQNRYLTERAIYRLKQEKFQPYWHQHIPPNDGGIALGQVIAARRNYEL